MNGVNWGVSSWSAGLEVREEQIQNIVPGMGLGQADTTLTHRPIL